MLLFGKKTIAQCFVLSVLFKITFTALFPHIAWLYWNTGYQGMGKYQKLCLQRVKDVHKDTNWEIRFLDDSTYKNWLNQENLKEFESTLNYKINHPQLKADLLRYYLLKQHGGVWLDVSIILKQNLNWIDNLLQNQKVFHRKIFKNPQAFIHFQHIQNRYHTVTVQMNEELYYPLFLIENAFIGAVKQSKFINDWIKQFTELVKYGQNHYFVQKSKFGVPYGYDDYFISFRACSINQYRKYNQFLLAKYSKTKPLEHLQNHFYNILIMNREVGMYHGSVLYHRIAQFLIDQQGKNGDYESPLIKISHGPANRFILGLLENNRSSKSSYHKLIYPKTYEFGQKYVYQFYQCLYSFQINQNSAINKYLLSNKTLVEQLFPNIHIIKNNQLPLICKMSSLLTLRLFYPVIEEWTINSLILLLAIQILSGYLLLLFKLSKQHFKSIVLLKSKLITHLTFIVAFYLQKDLILSQYQLWKQESPTSIQVSIIQFLCSFLIFVRFIKVFIRKQVRKGKFQIFFLALVLVFQYFIQYNFTVWKYEGEIYNYQNLNRLNLTKLQQGKLQLVKFFTWIIVSLIYQLFKKIFKFKDYGYNVLLSQNWHHLKSDEIIQKNDSNQNQNTPYNQQEQETQTNE